MVSGFLLKHVFLGRPNLQKKQEEKANDYFNYIWQISGI
jgi:hypothetical protein